MRTVAEALSGIFLGALMTVGYAGCGSASDHLCDKACDCIGEACTDDALSNCKKGFDDARETANDAGCGKEYDDILSCFDSEATCKDDAFVLTGICADEIAAGAKCAGRSLFD